MVVKDIGGALESRPSPSLTLGLNRVISKYLISIYFTIAFHLFFRSKLEIMRQMNGVDKKYISDSKWICKRKLLKMMKESTKRFEIANVDCMKPT